MINFQQRIQNLVDKRRAAHQELQRVGQNYKADFLNAKRAEIESQFQQGMAQLNADFQAAEAALSTEALSAEFDVYMARVEVREPWVSSYATAKLLLPSLSPSELAKFYDCAIAKGNQGGMIAVETHVPSFAPDDRAGRAALLEIASKAPAEQAKRTLKQSGVVKAAEDRLQNLREEYAAATLPIVQERAKTLAQSRESAF